jgi:EAL and modified HD-GYP domain-containing signal transduction protein
VLEILEDTPPDADVLAAMHELREAGYHLALDDFAYRAELEPFLALASIAKLDISRVSRAEIPSALARLKERGLLTVAERVETRDDLAFCRDAGFDFFQGFFLARPATLQRQRPPRGDRLAALQILALLNDASAPIDQLETAISRDVTLSYRLLRVINSAAFGMLGRIESLRQAIVHLGRARIRSWVSLLVLSGLSDKPPELLTTGLVRARMCEMLAERVDPRQASAYFTAGLFSVLDAILDTPMEQLVASLPLSRAIGQALVAREGQLGEMLEITMAYERCEWAEVGGDRLTLADVRDAYLEAVRWALSLREAVAV